MLFAGCRHTAKSAHAGSLRRAMSARQLFRNLSPSVLHAKPPFLPAVLGEGHLPVPPPTSQQNQMSYLGPKSFLVLSPLKFENNFQPLNLISPVPVSYEFL
jgi:hypothetical protein